MSSLLEEAEAILQRRTVEKKAAVNALALRQASGGIVAPELIVEITEAAGVSLEDYAKEVSRLENRKTLIAKVAAQAELEAQQQKCQKIMDKASAELTAAQERYSAAYMPAAIEHQRLGDQIGQAIAARAELRRTCRAPEIISRLNEIGNEVFQTQERAKALAERAKNLTNELGRLQPQLEDMEERRKHPRIQGDPRTTYVPGDFDQREQTRLQTSVDNMLAELPKVEEALVALPAAVASLQAEHAELLVKAEQSPL